MGSPPVDDASTRTAIKKGLRTAVFAARASTLDTPLFVAGVDPELAPTIHRCLTLDNQQDWQIKRSWLERFLTLLSAAVASLQNNPAGTEVAGDDGESIMSTMTNLTDMSGLSSDKEIEDGDADGTNAEHMVKGRDETKEDGGADDAERAKAINNAKEAKDADEGVGTKDAVTAKGGVAASKEPVPVSRRDRTRKDIGMETRGHP